MGIEASYTERRILTSGATILVIALTVLSLERYFYERDLYGRWENWKDCYSYIHNNFPAIQSTTILLPDDDRRQISYYLPDYEKYKVLSLRTSIPTESGFVTCDTIPMAKIMLVLTVGTTVSSFEDFASIAMRLSKKYDTRSEFVFGKRLSLNVFTNRNYETLFEMGKK